MPGSRPMASGFAKTSGCCIRHRRRRPLDRLRYYAESYRWGRCVWRHEGRIVRGACGGKPRVDAKRGGKIVNSRGQIDAAAWGRPAAWVDYHGPIDGQTVGITIFNHPSSFRYPTYWHVRTYGLFAANPFGLHEFPGSKNANGSLTLARGKSVTFRYRVLLHRGDEKQGKGGRAVLGVLPRKKQRRS